MTKKKSKIVITKKIIKNKLDKNKLHNILGKILIILIILSGIWYTQSNQKFSNSISLLAVSENSKGDIVSGSKVDLSLEIKPGTGQIYTNLNTLEEIDTQISIINSQKIACDLFNLNCKDYDFFYSFNGSAVILKGPSASSAIGIITAKTLNHEKIDKNTVITGSLNSGGIIGNVGGIDKKIEIAKNNNFSKIIIPQFSNYNETKINPLLKEIEIVKVVDIIEAYNNFEGKNFSSQKKELNFEKFSKQMRELSDMMCERTIELKKQINISNIEENSTLDKNFKQAQKSYNSSLNAYNIGNYYSAGSFCYNANINYRLIIESQKELNLSQREKINNELKNDLELRFVITNSDEYKNKIKTINDFYVYMLIIDRINEAQDFLKDTKNNNQNNIIIQENQSNKTININQTKLLEIKDKEEQIKLSDMRIAYSYAFERIYTVDLWENFIINDGNLINFNEKKLDEACTKINYENNIKNQLLKEYGANYFNAELNEINLLAQNPFENKYLCIYKGLELNGKMNTILNAIGIEKVNEENYINKLIEITQNRLGINSNDNFPLIPYIYFEYSKDLALQKDYNSAMLYSNFALSYADLDLYIEIEEYNEKDFFNILIKDLFNFEKLSLLFIVSLLVILGFS